MDGAAGSKIELSRGAGAHPPVAARRAIQVDTIWGL